MAKVQKKGLVRIYNAGKYSMKGFKAGLENEAAIRQEIFLGVILTLVAFYSLTFHFPYVHFECNFLHY